MIAEFIRRRHHLRAANVIEKHQSQLGRLAFDDPQLEEAISSVCVAHGLRSIELEDDFRFPDRRDILGEPVNLKFLAIVLRLGDLLDMGTERACPLLTGPASPLPSESLAHWTQYQKIVHRLTAPDRIEIRAECDNQDEHRVLQDWCKWIVEEVESATALMINAHRHGGWIPPLASLKKGNQTISILPSHSAAYVPSDWRLRLDPEMIFERLIYDVHGNDIGFIFELIQTL